jgi:hypothetical protein
MKGSFTALCLTALLGAAGAASATTAVLDFGDPSKTSNVTVVANADGKTTEVTEGGVKAVQTSGTDGTPGYLYLNVKDDLFKDSKALWARVDYFDQGTDTFTVEYDTEADPVMAASPTRKKFDTRVWTSQVFKLLDFQLQGRQEGGSDIRINDQGDGPEIISKVTVTDEDPDKFHFPKVDAAKPITIDGKKSEGEWAGAFSVTLDRPDQDVVNAFISKEDFSGTYSYKWSEQGLYILGEVTDATPRLNDAPGPNYWNGDGIEQFIGLDQSNPSRTTFNLDTDFQVVISMGDPAKGGPGPSWAVWHGSGSDPAPEDKGTIPASNVAVVNTDTGYTFELLLPWTLLKADAKVTEGQEIGWYMFANNSRSIGPSNQDMAMTPFKRPNPSTNPSVWATAVLEPAKTVETPPAAGN